MSDFPDVPDFLREPQEQPVAPESHKKQTHKVRRAAVAVGLVIGGYMLPHPNGDTEKTSVSEISEIDLEAPARVQLDIAAAVEADTCDTKVTAEDVESIYTRLFVEEEGKEPSLEELENQADEILARHKGAREKLEFNKLTENFENFVNDAYSTGFSDSYRTYKAAFKEFLKPWDIKLIDKWPKGSLNEKQLQASGVTSGLNQHQLDDQMHSYSAKVQIVRAMQGLATIPSQIVEQYGPKTIVLADFEDKRYDGYAFYEDRVIALNTKEPKGVDGKNAAILHGADLIGHETAHLYTDMLCSHIISNYVDDPGFTLLNRSFEYSKRNVKALDKGQLVENSYTSLGSNFADAQAVVTRGYGATNVEEDKATLLGENILYAAPVGRFYAEVESDPTIVHEKLSLLLARISEKDPVVGEYYISMLELTKLSQTVNEIIWPLNSALQDTLGEEYSGSIKGPIEEPLDNPAYIAAKQKLQPYNDLSSRIYAALEQTTNPNQSVRDYEK